MSKKTKAEKHQRRVGHQRTRVRRNGRRPNPGYGKILPDAVLTSVVEDLAFGQLGCAILRALDVKPIDVLNSFQVHLTEEREHE